MLPTYTECTSLHLAVPVSSPPDLARNDTQPSKGLLLAHFNSHYGNQGGGWETLPCQVHRDTHTIIRSPAEPLRLGGRHSGGQMCWVPLYGMT